MNRNLLLVAYHYPPDNAIGAARPARFAKYLPGAGWGCQVLTAAPQPRTAQNIHFVEDRTRGLWQGDTTAKPAVPVIQRYFELLLRRALFPGMSGLSWWWSAAAEGARLARESRQAPAAVLSTFPPLPAHMAARRLAGVLGIPWIADFRDPFPHHDPTGMPPVAAAVSRRMEARCFRDADAIIVNTEAMAAMYRRLYPFCAPKLHVVWNGFDPEDTLAPVPLPRRSSLVLSHVGTLYCGRNPIAILESLERLRAAGDPEALRCTVELVGPNFSSPEEQKVLDRCAAAGWLDLRAGLIPQAEARQLTQQADGLLLLQPQTAIQVPGKLFEYIRTGRPVLSLAPKNSPIEWILGQSGSRHTCLYPEDAPHEMDRKLADFLRGGWESSVPSDWFETNFNASRQAEELAEILNRTLRGKRS